MNYLVLYDDTQMPSIPWTSHWIQKAWLRWDPFGDTHGDSAPFFRNLRT